MIKYWKLSLFEIAKRTRVFTISPPNQPCTENLSQVSVVFWLKKKITPILYFFFFHTLCNVMGLWSPSWIWAGLVFCFGQKNMAKLTVLSLKRPLSLFPSPPFSLSFSVTLALPLAIITNWRMRSCWRELSWPSCPCCGPRYARNPAHISKGA